jgi:hypothetical protein
VVAHPPLPVAECGDDDGSECCCGGAGFPSILLSASYGTEQPSKEKSYNQGHNGLAVLFEVIK